MKSDLEFTIPVEETTVTVANGIVTVKGKLWEVSKKLFHPNVSITVKDGEVVLTSKNATRSEKKIILTYVAHITNLIKGVTEGFVYELKICSGHFPMSVAVKGNELEVKNFLGESYPRKLTLSGKNKVEINGEIITVEGCDKELAGQEAARIESVTRITNRDRRIFQDGIYITKKAGKEI